MGPLAALVQHYAMVVARTRALPHLGLPSARRGEFPGGWAASPLLYGPPREIHGRTKDKRGIGVAYDGVPTLLAAPVSQNKMRQIVMDLVLQGAHPEDIMIWDYDPDRDEITEMRTAVDHLLWTYEDQARLERRQADQ